MKRIDLPEATLEMRKVLTVKLGDTLLFQPGVEATGGEQGAWFKKYCGMEAEVLGFDEDQMTGILASALRFVGEEQRGEKVVGRFFVRFENGDEPDFSILTDHFVVP